jgi:hypothetical protein
MPLLSLLILLIIVGVVLWLVNTYIPMDPKIKMIINIVIVLVVIIYLLKLFGVFSGMNVGQLSMPMHLLA